MNLTQCFMTNRRRLSPLPFIFEQSDGIRKKYIPLYETKSIFKRRYIMNEYIINGTLFWVYIGIFIHLIIGICELALWIQEKYYEHKKEEA